MYLPRSVRRDGDMVSTLTIKGIEYCTCKPWAWLLLVAKITEELALELGAALLPLNLLNAFNWEARDEELRNSKVCSRFLRRMQTVSPLACASLRIMGVECRSAAITDVVEGSPPCYTTQKKKLVPSLWWVRSLNGHIKPKKC